MKDPANALLEQLTPPTAQAADRARLHQVVDGLRFHVVVVPRAGSPSPHEFETLEAAAEYVRSIAGQGVQVFLFQGHRLAITRGPYQYLMGTAGEKLPLFRAAVEDVDPDGWLTAPDSHEVLPSSLAPEPPTP